jgi:hypothetical protein
MWTVFMFMLHCRVDTDTQLTFFAQKARVKLCSVSCAGCIAHAR